MNAEMVGYKTRNETFFKGRPVDRADLFKVYAYCPRYGGMVSSDKFKWVDEETLHFTCLACGHSHEVKV